jgi:hypothetical protein
MKLFALFFFAVINCAFAAVQNFDLVNESGRDINSVYLAREGETNWGEDILDYDQELYDGHTVHVKFDNDEEAQWWYIKVVFVGGKWVTWDTKFNLFRVYRMTVESDSSGGYHIYYQYTQ